MCLAHMQKGLGIHELVLLFTVMENIKEVDIEADGTFKYILIKLIDKEKSKFIVRGYNWAMYHGMFAYIKQLYFNIALSIL